MVFLVFEQIFNESLTGNGTPASRALKVTNVPDQFTGQLSNRNRTILLSMFCQCRVYPMMARLGPIGIAVDETGKLVSVVTWIPAVVVGKATVGHQGQEATANSNIDIHQHCNGDKEDEGFVCEQGYGSVFMRTATATHPSFLRSSVRRARTFLPD